MHSIGNVTQCKHIYLDILIYYRKNIGNSDLLPFCQIVCLMELTTKSDNTNLPASLFQFYALSRNSTMTNQELMAAMMEAGRLHIVHIGEPVNRLTIVNDFTGRETTVDTSRPMTARRALDIRRRLCSDDCTSGDTLGARGPQAEGYRELLDRADRAILTTLEGF
jgi:hypothetical protein